MQRKLLAVIFGIFPHPGVRVNGQVIAVDKRPQLEALNGVNKMHLLWRRIDGSGISAVGFIDRKKLAKTGPQINHHKENARSQRQPVAFETQPGEAGRGHILQ